MATIDPNAKAAGLLLEAFDAGLVDEILWTKVAVGDLEVTVAADALKAQLGDLDGVRLPVSYAETVVICTRLECVAPTQAICDAMFAQAKARLGLVSLVQTQADAAKMLSVDFVQRFHDGVEKELEAQPVAPGDLVFGAWKLWILHPRIVERGAVNYGFWNLAHDPPAPVQNVGAAHDAGHYDYSQLLQPVKRLATRTSTGETVDLLDVIAAEDGVPAGFLAPYRGQ